MTPHKQTILKFLKTHPLATIATTNPDTSQPESALVAFAEIDSLELIFETFEDTRKLRNMLSNPQVSLVIGWDITHHVTVQYEGLAFPIPADEADKYRSILLAKDTPCTETFLNNPRVRLFKISPRWIRYSDYTKAKPHIIEVDFPHDESQQ